MVRKKYPKNRLVKVVFAIFLMFMGVFSALLSVSVSTPVYAEPEQELVEENEETTETVVEEQTQVQVSQGQSCKDSLGSVGWLVCPVTGVISQAVDTMYDLIKGVLVINPVEIKDGQPVYEMWKYFRAVTNIVFIIFLLVIIYSQVTGLGINNYGIKKALPKLIVMAILVNLSFVICSLAVDVSNIVGNGLRGVLENIEAASVATMDWNRAADGLKMAEMYEALAGGIALGGTLIAFSPGSIFMLIPVALGAVVAVVSGLITIALRQALVVVLIIVAPLAMVANILPNTESLFTTWKKLLTRMLVFYPMFSLLFGASHLAGFAIIASAKDGFGLLLGIAVQIFPLFFCWKLMEMSGTILGTINSKMRGLAEKPLSASRTWAESHKSLMNAKQLAKKDPYSLPTKLQQALSDRKISRENELKELNTLITNRGLAFGAGRNYDKNGVPTKEGEEAYERVGRNLEYQSVIERDKNNLNKGLGQLEAVKLYGTAEQKARLGLLDGQVVNASDKLKMELARGETIEYANARGLYNRMEAAINAHVDDVSGYEIDANGVMKAKDNYKFHFDNVEDFNKALNRYNVANEIMEGDVVDTQYAAATAAQGYDTQMKIIATKMNKYYDMLPPSADLTYRMKEFTRIGMNGNIGRATDNIDSIIAGFRVINQRGDTDVVKNLMDDIMDEQYGGLELGTHASQALASFLMFEVKDSDPFLRRFGKYINLETAAIYNDNGRKKMEITYDEYVKGYHIEPDGRIMYAKKDMKKLAEGTSLDNIERTALDNLDDSLKKAYGYDPEDENKEWDMDGYLKKREDIQTSFEPAFLSSSMKWMSGSEQIGSAVKFWTGYNLKPRKDDEGNLVLNDKKEPIYDLMPVWEKEKDEDKKTKLENYYRRKTMDFFKDQTTGQILNMRTDYRDATMEHLIAEYISGKPGDEEADERRREYEEKRAEIQTRYGDLDANEAQKKREKDMVKLKREIAGRQLRKILGVTGKLEQIYNTRDSGTAINAKDWLRKMVGLDDEEELYKEIQQYKQSRTKSSSTSGTNSQGGTVVYDAQARDGFKNDLDRLWQNSHNSSVEDFYIRASDKINEWFGANTTSVLKKEFDEYYTKHENDIGFKARNLKTFLDNLLNDTSKYPGA